MREDGDPNGKTVMLIHGFGGSLHWFDAVVPYLIPEYRVIRTDLNGHGCTGGNHGLDVASQARTQAAVLDRLDSSDATVAGHSLGADIAVAMGGETPRVTRVMIVGQAPDFESAHFPAANRLMTVPILGHVLHRTAPRAVIRVSMQGAFRPGYDQRRGFRDPDQLIHDFRAMHPDMYRANLIDRRVRLEQCPLDTKSRNSSVATTVVLGRLDQFFDCDLDAARYRKAGIPVHIVEETGHSIHVEQPGRLASQIKAFTTTS